MIFLLKFCGVDLYNEYRSSPPSSSKKTSLEVELTIKNFNSQTYILVILYDRQLHCTITCLVNLQEPLTL